MQLDPDLRQARLKTRLYKMNRSKFKRLNQMNPRKWLKQKFNMHWIVSLGVMRTTSLTRKQKISETCWRGKWWGRWVRGIVLWTSRKMMRRTIKGNNLCYSILTNRKKNHYYSSQSRQRSTKSKVQACLQEQTNLPCNLLWKRSKLLLFKKPSRWMIPLKLFSETFKKRRRKSERFVLNNIKMNMVLDSRLTWQKFITISKRSTNERQANKNKDA